MDVDELQRADLEETDQLILTLRTIGGESVGRWSLAGLSASDLVREGHLWTGPRTLVRPVIGCPHRDAALRWRRYPGCQLVTGMALTSGGHWTPHTWTLETVWASHRREVVETGTPRVQYFGLELTGAIRDAFLQAQLR